MSAIKKASQQITPGDRLYPVASAFEKVSGERPHPTSVCRWCRKGTAGLPLPSLLVSGRRMTSLEALEQWLQDITARRNLK